MKKLLSVLCFVLMLTSCTANKDVAEVDDKTDVISENKTEKTEDMEKNKDTEDAPENEKENTVPQLSVEDIFWDLKGFHVATDYIDDFAKTRSAVLSKDKFAAISIYAENGEYFIMQGLSNQGGPEGKFESAEHDGNGGYKLIFKKKDDSGVDCEIYYTPGKKVVSGKFDNDLPMWTLNKDVYDFYRYSDGEAMNMELTRLVFAGIEAVEAHDFVILKIGENYYKPYVSAYHHSGSPFMLDEGDGGFVELICYSGEGGRIFAKYRYENGKVTITDEYGEVLGVFE